MSIEKYHRVPLEHTTHHTLGLYGRLLGTYSTRASCVCTMAVFGSSIYEKGVKTVCCIEQGDWSLSELEAVMYEHAHNLRTNYFWVQDEPARKFFRSQTTLRKYLKAVALGADALSDDDIRIGVSALECQLDSGRILLPSASGVMHPEVAGFAADLNSFDPSNLRSVTLRVLAVACCSVACSKKVKAQQLTYYYDQNDRLQILPAAQVQRAMQGGPRIPPLPLQESSEMQEARRRGQFLQATNFGIQK